MFDKVDEDIREEIQDSVDEAMTAIESVRACLKDPDVRKNMTPSDYKEFDTLAYSTLQLLEELSDDVYY